MLILSGNKKDYYDGVAGTMGIDKTIVYERKIIELEKNEFPKFFKGVKENSQRESLGNSVARIGQHKIKKEFRNKYDTYSYFIVGFCGKLYIGWILYKESINSKFSPTLIYDKTYTFNINDVIPLIENNMFYGKFIDDVNYVLSYDIMYLFRELNTPVFIYDANINEFKIKKYNSNYFNPKFIINPTLNDYQFYKVFDSFQAFQEIQMFLGGVLGRGEKDIIEISDKHKIEQHGFDYKLSFRKEPQNKK